MNQALLRTDDEYYTPKHVWEDISEVIPKDKVIWEAFKGDGRSADYLREMGRGGGMMTISLRVSEKGT